MQETAIGVFDSGVGGLSVLRAIRALLPAESLLFVADAAYVPYGGKSEALIRERSRVLSRFLVERGAKAIVVACNTATAAAVTCLRDELAQPVVAMEPAIKPAARISRSGVVGVLATSGTLGSRRFAELSERFGAGIRILTQPCPGLVEQVEKGDIDGPETRALLERYLEPLLSYGADTLILGCTHYPFLRPLIREMVGPEVALIDTGAAVAAQLRRVLVARNLLCGSGDGDERFWTSAGLGSSAAVMASLWPRSVPVSALPQVLC